MTETASGAETQLFPGYAFSGVTGVHSSRLFESGRFPRMTKNGPHARGAESSARGPFSDFFFPRKDIMDNKQFDDFKDLDVEEAAPSWTNLFDNALWQCEALGKDPLIHLCLERGKKLHLADLARRKT